MIEKYIMENNKLKSNSYNKAIGIIFLKYGLIFPTQNDVISFIIDDML